MNKLTAQGFTGIIAILGLYTLGLGVWSGLGIVENENGIIWKDVSFELSMGVALLTGVWLTERSALLGAGLIGYGLIVIGVATLWTIAIPIAMGLLAVGALVRAIALTRERGVWF